MWTFFIFLKIHDRFHSLKIRQSLEWLQNLILLANFWKFWYVLSDIFKTNCTSSVVQILSISKCMKKIHNFQKKSLKRVMLSEHFVSRFFKITFLNSDEIETLERTNCIFSVEFKNLSKNLIKLIKDQPYRISTSPLYFTLLELEKLFFFFNLSNYSTN